MIGWLLAAALLAGCAERLPDRYDGVPAGASCSWDIVHADRGVCVADGERFRCVREAKSSGSGHWLQISCSKQRVWR